MICFTRTTNRRCWLAFFCVLVGTCGHARADELAENASARLRMRTLATKQDAPGLIEFYSEMEVQWKASKREVHAQVMRDTIGALTAYEGTDFNGCELAQARTFALLEDADHFSLDLEMRLLKFLSYPSAAPNGTAEAAHRVSERRRKTRLYFHGIHRAEASIDPNFDPEDRALMNMAPPVTTGLPSGVGPEAVEDPILRAEFVAALAGNEEKYRRWSIQMAARNALETHRERLMLAVSDLYAETPDATAELLELISEFKLGRDTRSGILMFLKQARPEFTGGFDEPPTKSDSPVPEPSSKPPIAPPGTVQPLPQPPVKAPDAGESWTWGIAAVIVVFMIVMAVRRSNPRKKPRNR